MRVAVPMKVIEVSEYSCTAEIDGVKKQASLMMLEGVNVGDYIMVHAGFAIEKVDPESARETISLMREIVESENDET